jgi:hypothetical protein
VASGKWQVASGKWQMANGKWILQCVVCDYMLSQATPILCRL